MVVAVDLRVIAIVVIVMFILFLAVLGYTIAMYAGASKRLRDARGRMDHIRHMEHLSRLRHRSLEAFAKELNILRAKKGKRGIPTATLEKIQYNLMYSIDED